MRFNPYEFIQQNSADLLEEAGMRSPCRNAASKVVDAVIHVSRG